MTDIKLRPWQSEAAEKTLQWLVRDKKDKHFLTNAAPASGKTIYASYTAARMIEMDEIDRVIVIAPTKEVVRKWGEEFYSVTKRHMTKVTSSDDSIESLGVDLCATWAAVEGLLEAFQKVCSTSRTLVICDEHHHAAQEASWGEGANAGLSDAKYSLILTGTPIRSDGKDTVWVKLDDYGKIKYKSAGSYTLTYGEAVELDYCRPVTFHRHNAQFNVKLDEDNSVIISGGNENIESIPESLKSFYKSDQLQRSLNFYKLAQFPKYEKDLITPSKDSFHSSMVEWLSLIHI